MITRNRFSLSVTLLLLGALSMQAFAQTAATPQNMNQTQTETFRRQAPPPLPARQLTIPTPYETTLPNGLQVVIVEQPRLPLVSFRLALRGGDANDPSELPGLTDMVTGMLSEGTETRTSRQIADQVARLGASLSAGSNSDYTTIAASSLAMYKDQILDLMADIALHPSFPEDELNRAKQNAKQGLTLQRGQASFLAGEQAARVLFGQHPYSVVSPTAQAIDAITRERLMSQYRSMFVPNNAVLLVIGDVNRAEMMRRITSLFGSWARGTVAAARTFPAPPTHRTCDLFS